MRAGVLAAGAYFDSGSSDERVIRELAEMLYRRADWGWALNGGTLVSHGWRPEKGFIRYRWAGYNEALILYLLGLGSPTHSLPEASYGGHAWGITAGDGPGPARRRVDGVERRFYAYKARGVPWGPDDGTVSRYGFKCSLNPTFPVRPRGWISNGYYGLGQGPVVLMIENHRSGLVWQLTRECPHVIRGLRRAGFAGGWLLPRRVRRVSSQEPRRKSHR